MAKGRLALFLALVVAVAEVGSAGPRARAQDEVVPPTPTVNVEFILDASGSMANITNTGETRMEAAKRVLREVVGSIPDRGGAVNVGFRIYGHKGDNSEATKAVSCKASELLVPIDGIDRDALTAAIDSAQPTGWTPLALSIGRAGRDFSAADESIVNAAVVLTDGLETCDGDPVAQAKRFRKRKDSRMITHVVGFGTTPEEQQVLSGIAEKGDGLLLGAGNAAELRSALFSVLEELQIVVGVGYVGGNAFSLVPEGEPGEVAVVAYGPLNALMQELPFVLRNNTGENIVGPKVSVTVRDSAGGLLGAGNALFSSPYFVRSGGIAFGSIFFGSAPNFPSDAVYAFEVETTPVADARHTSFADLDIVEASLFEGRIVGTAKNGFDSRVDGPLFFSAVCFDEAGNVLGHSLGMSDAGDLDPDETQTFQVDLYALTYAGLGCPAFLVAGRGSGPPRLPQQPSSGTTSSAAPTAEATTEPDAAAGADFVLPGLQDAALRSFESDAGVTDGVIALSAMVAKFSTESSAADGLQLVVDRYFALRASRGDGTTEVSEPRKASAPKLGERRLGMTFTITSSGIEFPAAVLAVQKGDLVYFFLALSVGVNPMEALAEVGTAVITDGPRTVDPDGLKSGGLWDLLPTLDEVPFGLFVVEEKVPEDWGPVPAPE